MASSGSVKWFNSEKGYGFISPADGGQDLFVHFSNLSGDGFRTLNEGDKVQYEVRDGKKGPEAFEVSVA